MSTQKALIALQASLLGFDDPVPNVVVADVFSEWSEGTATDQELVDHLMPGRNQNPLQRLQNLAMSINLAQTLLTEAEAEVLKDKQSTLEHLERIEQLEQSSVSQAVSTALERHLDALDQLERSLQEFDSHAILESLELGSQAQADLRHAYSILEN